MTISLRHEDGALFSLWIRRSTHPEPFAFVIRFEALAGQGALRFGRGGKQTPASTTNGVHDLSADQIRGGVFVHHLQKGRDVRKAYTLWGAAQPPEALPCGEWVPMRLRGDLLVPDGWAVAADNGQEDEITELVPSPRRLSSAMKAIKERRMVRGEQAPTGLVRHLRRTIERQQREIDFLRGQLAEYRR